jgi:DNA-binding response OmpR family regulator
MSPVRILLASDLEDSGNLVREVLTAGGHDVFQTTNAGVTLAIIEAEEPDLLILDMFTARESDWPILNALLLHVGAPPVVALTGHLASPEALATLAFQARGRIVKPFEPSALLEMCERAVTRTTAAPDAGWDQTRAEPRVLFSCDATLLTDGGLPMLALRVVDLSEGGAKLEIGRRLASKIVAGSRIKIRLLRPPDFQPVVVDAEVRWRSDDAMGVRLLG